VTYRAAPATPTRASPFNAASTQSGNSNLSGISSPQPAGFRTPNQQQQADAIRLLNNKLAATRGASQALQQAPGTNIYGVERLPWIFATFDDVRRSGGLTNAKDAIFWSANPRSVSWQIGQRGSEEKNKSGTVLHVWRDRKRGSDYDDPKITMQFQSGNIMPEAPVATLTDRPVMPERISSGLNNFYQFLQLVDAKKISTTGQANLIHILYRSRIFPSMILTGFFDPNLVVQFSDDSTSPNTVSGWSATFTVYSTTPRLNNFKELTQRFQAEGLAGFQTV
jgi:hypothetical protein